MWHKLRPLLAHHSTPEPSRAGSARAVGKTSSN
jgi:hypothetical protein